MAFSITINKQLFAVDLASDPFVTSTTTLAQFIRNRTVWKGTKVACAEGGCGACTVALGYTDPATGKPAVKSINSCLALLLSLNGTSVTTNEGIGNAVIGYHPIQQKLAALSGTQCGYCSSGMVMLLYSYLQQHPAATALELEQILDGNICRCTGYRPILDTFKSFAASGAAHDAFAPTKKCMQENCCQKRCGKFANLSIEDAGTTLDSSDSDSDGEGATTTTRPTTDAQQPPISHTWYAPPAPSRSRQPPKKRSGKTRGPMNSSAAEQEQQQQQHADPVVAATAAPITWQDVTTLKDLQYYVALAASSGQTYLVAVGATSRAIYPSAYTVYLNAQQVPDLQVLTQSATGVTIGAAVTVADARDFTLAVTTAQAYQTQNFAALAEHLGRVAGVSIRNRASIGGNLMLVQQHHQPDDFFPSDICIALLGLGATVSVVSATGGAAPQTYTLGAFLGLTMVGRILVSIFVPFATSATSVYRTYKIAKRQVMAHAFVNAAFKVDVDAATNTITGGVVVAIGGVLAAPTRVASIEAALVGLQTTSLAAFQGLCQQLQTYLTANVAPLAGRTAYRVQTAVNYFYKFFLALQPASAQSAMYAKAAQHWMVRPVSTASQTFGSDPSEYPVSMAIPKLDGLAQTSGEAVYTADIPAPYGGLHGAIVQTTVARATIASVNAAVSASVPGFVRYFDQTSIPSGGANSLSTGPLFATGTSNFAGQCVGLVVAKTREIALECAALIQATIQYTNQQPPILTCQQALDNLWIFPVPVPSIARGQSPDAVFPTCATVVSGSLDIGSQYHLHLENHCAVAEVVEGQLCIDAATQTPIMAQGAVAGVLGLSKSSVQVRTRRCGGGYGGKLTNSMLGASLAALAASALQVPVSVELTLQDPMRGLGARPQYLYQYKMGLDANNKILALKGKLYLAVGYTFVDSFIEAPGAMKNLDNCYNIPNFLVDGAFLKTSIAPATSVRGPGWIQAILLQEMVMEAAAAQLKISAKTLREANFYQRGDSTPAGMPLTTCNLQRVWAEAQSSANYADRVASVAAFNTANKFVQRGLSINPVRFGVDWSWPQYNATVAVYADGSIATTIGGIEIGQGINTKVAQAIAFKLGLDVTNLPKIKIQPSDTRVIPNPMNMTGGSITSELCCLTVMHACEELNRRLRPFRTGDWAVTCGLAGASGVDMLATGYSGQPTSPGYSRYNSWGCAVTEVEVDGLTGQFEIKRTDIVFDCGISLNPAIDVGQVEGGFAMGIGWFTMETPNYDSLTGKAMDATTWEYKPPMASDIPEVLNVTLLANAANASGVLSSKACGEPPLGLAVSVVHALQHAINAVRAQVGLQPTVVTAVPLGVDTIAALCGVTPSAYAF